MKVRVNGRLFKSSGRKVHVNNLLYVYSSRTQSSVNNTPEMGFGTWLKALLRADGSASAAAPDTCGEACHQQRQRRNSRRASLYWEEPRNGDDAAFHGLPSDLVLAVCRWLPHNEVACNVRMVSIIVHG